MSGLLPSPAGVPLLRGEGVVHAAIRCLSGRLRDIVTHTSEQDPRSSAVGQSTDSL